MVGKEALEPRFEGRLDRYLEDTRARPAAREEARDEEGREEGDRNGNGRARQAGPVGSACRACWSKRPPAPRSRCGAQAFLPRRKSWAARPPATTTARKTKTVCQVKAW